MCSRPARPHLKDKFRAGEVAYCVKCLLHKDWVMISQNLPAWGFFVIKQKQLEEESIYFILKL